MMKKGVMMLMMMFILSSFVLAEKINLNIITKEVNPSENVTFKIELYDSNNNPLRGEADITLENPEKMIIFEDKFLSDSISAINIEENASFGDWKIIAKYKDVETSDSFFVKSKENIRFTLDKDVLTITNLGNTKYSKTIKIFIGDSVGTKDIELNVGEKVNLRLLGQDGNYNIKVTDGENTITRENVALTGNVIGILDEKLEKSSNPLTSSSDTPSKKSSNSLLVYAFLIGVFGTAILLLIERTYRNKVKQR